jgi:hypothetical protein
VDRFSRDVGIGISLAEAFIANGNKLYFIREKLLVEKTTGNEWQQLFKYLTFAEQESKNIADRTSTAKRYLASLGYCTTAIPPFGFKKRKLSNGHHALEKNVLHAKIARFIALCRKPNAHLTSLNKYLQVCTNDKVDIELSISDKLIEPLSWQNITNLLNDYHVEGSWTARTVSRIHYKEKNRGVVSKQ